MYVVNLIIEMEKLIGVVLCGGKSSRMGRDKGLILMHGKPWAMICAEKLQELGLRVLVSINDSQKEEYSKYFPLSAMVMDNWNEAGPIGGILTVHKQFENSDLLVLACDLVDMDVSTLKVLVNMYATKQYFHYYAFHNGRFWEPLCCIYTGRVLQSIPVLARSLQDVLGSGNALKIPIQNAGCFKNYNRLDLCSNSFQINI